MNCIICGGQSEHSFSKIFDGFDLGKVDYWTCKICGFTLSETHRSMSAARWEQLNRDCHNAYQGSDCNPTDPRWLERLNAQSAVIHQADQAGLLPHELPWVDFACGDGKLSDLLHTDFGLTLGKYESYMQNKNDYLPSSELHIGGFDFVITTSVFEHLTERSQFDTIASLVSDKGVLGLHTLVREEIPPDPTWFYLQAPHCAFHTNRSMEILFRQWGYKSSAYHVASRLWLWFKTDMRGMVDSTQFIYRDGFVDYWK